MDLEAALLREIVLYPTTLVLVLVLRQLSMIAVADEDGTLTSVDSVHFPVRKHLSSDHHHVLSYSHSYLFCIMICAYVLSLP